jgi:hypothetical protein
VHLAHAQPGQAAALAHQCLQRGSRQPDLAVRRHRRLQLEQVGAHQRAQHGEPLAALAELVPGLASQPLQDDVRDQRALAQGATGKADAQRPAHEAAAAVGAHQVAGAYGPHALRTGDARGHAVRVLGQADQGVAEPGAVAQLQQALAQDRLGGGLRHHQRQRVGLGRRGRTGLGHRHLGMAAVRAVAAQWRVGAAGGRQAVEHAQHGEDLQAARLQALAAGAVERPLPHLDQLEPDPAAGQFDGQDQAGGAGATDQHVGFVARFHRRPPECAKCTHGGHANGVGG